MQSYELRLSSDKSRVIGRNTTILVFENIDADFQHVTLAELGVNARKAIETALWQDQFNRPVNTAGTAR